MPLMRESPLPVGWYAVDVPASKRKRFQAWLELHSGHLAVRSTYGSKAIGAGEEGFTRYVFEVREKGAVPWEGPGLPEVVKPDTSAAADEPDLPEGPLERMTEAVDQALGGSHTGWLLLGGVLLGGFLWWQSRPKTVVLRKG